MNKLFVEIDNPTAFSHHSPEQYGDWEEYSYYSGCRVYAGDYSDNATNYRASAEVPFKVTPGMVVFPVVVVYSTGNTFGRSSGNATLVDVFDDESKARGLQNAINSVTNSGNYSFGYEGKEYYAGTWTGYFERLEDVVVETEVVRLLKSWEVDGW